MMNEIKLKALTTNLQEVLSFVDGHLEDMEASEKVRMQVDVAVEELFVNIAKYAYASGEGMATISVDKDKENKQIIITFADNGKPYNPLKNSNPDITLSAEERSIGGVGIFIVKKCMDDVRYEYKDNQNILTITKKLKKKKEDTEG